MSACVPERLSACVCLFYILIYFSLITYHFCDTVDINGSIAHGMNLDEIIAKVVLAGITYMYVHKTVVSQGLFTPSVISLKFSGSAGRAPNHSWR